MKDFISIFTQIYSGMIAVLVLVFVTRTAEREGRYNRHTWLIEQFAKDPKKKEEEEKSRENVDQDTKIQNRLFLFCFVIWSIFLIVFLWVPQPDLENIFIKLIISILVVGAAWTICTLAWYPYTGGDRDRLLRLFFVKK